VNASLMEAAALSVSVLSVGKLLAAVEEIAN